MKDEMLQNVRTSNSFKACISRCCPENRGKTVVRQRRSARRVLKQQIHLEIDEMNNDQFREEAEIAKFYEDMAIDEDEAMIDEYFRTRQEAMDDALECILLDEEMFNARNLEEYDDRE